jgi:CRP-like cAMP-binding protein
MHPTRKIDIPQFLSHIPLFQDIGEEALARLAEGVEMRRVERGEYVFHVGDPCDSFYFLALGQVRLFVIAPNGNEKVIELIGPGMSFAEALMFLGKPCLVNAQALADTLLLVIHREELSRELERDGHLAMRMLAGLSRRLHGLVHDVQAYALQSGVQRVVGYLLRDIADAEMSGPTIVTLPVSKATVASRLSLTPEYFSRVLHELEAHGLIEIDKRDIHILDAAALAIYPAQ